MIEKPEPLAQRPALNYFDCRDYINKKYDIDIDDNDGNNFWHTVLDHHSINNDTTFDMYDEYPEYHEIEKWEIDIYDLFFKEFAEYVNGGCLRFWVSW